MTAHGPLPVDLDQQRAHGQLLQVLALHTEAGQPVPCLTDRHAGAWISDDPESMEYAATRCLACPAVQDCRAYVDAHPEPAGVWAGATPAERKRKRNG